VRISPLIHALGACKNCPFIDACPTCVGYNWEIYGAPQYRTNYHCEFILLQLLASTKLAYLKINDKIEELLHKKQINKNDPILKKLKLELTSILNVMRIIPDILSKKGFNE